MNLFYYDHRGIKLIVDYQFLLVRDVATVKIVKVISNPTSELWCRSLVCNVNTSYLAKMHYEPNNLLKELV